MPEYSGIKSSLTMTQTEQIEKIVDYLKTHLDPVFAYLIVDDSGMRPEEPFLEIPYYTGLPADEYRICELENELMQMIESRVSLIELSECDALLAGELLAEGKLIYCQNSLMYQKYLHMLAREFDLVQVQRRVLIERIKDCGTVFAQ